MYPQEERRQSPQCPCIHIVGLEAKTKGDIELVQQAMKGYLNDFRQLREDVKECFLDMEQTAKLFAEGQRKFDKFDSELSIQSKRIADVQTELTKMLQLEISARTEDRKELFEGCNKKNSNLEKRVHRAELGLLVYLLTLFATGHAGQMLAWFKDLFKLGFRP